MYYSDMILEQDKYMIFSDLENLDIYCEYLLNDDNKRITHSHLLNLYELINKMDERAFNNNDAKMGRYYFIKNYLEAKVAKGMIKRQLCLNYVLENTPAAYHHIIKREIINSFEPGELGDKDLEFINTKIFADLNYIFMNKYRTSLFEILQDIESNKIREHADDLIPLFQVMLSDLTRAKRRSIKNNAFNLSDPIAFNNLILSTLERLQSPQNFLKSGYKGLNKMLNGGFENGRVYNVIGGTGGFKSGFLLNIMKSFKIFNKNTDRRRSQKKRRTILFISQENNIYETVERIFNIFASVDRMKNFTIEEVLDMLNKGGFSVVNDEHDIDIEFRYYGNEDIGVADMKGIVEELDNNGKEVIAIIQDYIERLKPPKRNVDRRIQLFDISNQMHDLAVELDIPIITASQINRKGIEAIELTKLKSNRSQSSIDVGQKDISESFGMLKNIDVNLIIIPQYNPDERRFYLYIKKLKFRGADDGLVDELYHPFNGFDSKIMLVDDLNTKNEVWRKSLYEMPEYDNRFSNDDRSAIPRKRLMPSSIDVNDDPEEIGEILKQFEEASSKHRMRLFFTEKYNAKVKEGEENDLKLKRRKAKEKKFIKLQLTEKGEEMMKGVREALKKKSA